MFERFTNQARHTIVLAQEEARGLQHNYIGTEHLLLGLLGEPDGIAALALGGFGISLTSTRAEVAKRVRPAKKPISGHIPFTPRAKKVLELGLREALALNHSYIGTEHLLLGMIREADGVGVKILGATVSDLSTVRLAVLDLLPAAQPADDRHWLRRLRGALPGAAEEADSPRTTPAADASLQEAARLAGPHAVGSHHLLLAALGDPDNAVARVLTKLGLDLDQTRAALRQVDVTGTSDEPPEEAGARQMSIQVSEDRVTIEATDETLVGLARAAVEAVGDDTGTIAGDHPASVSLGNVWLAARASLDDIRRRATRT